MSIFGDIWGGISDTFSQDEVNPYIPKRENFYLGGQKGYANQQTNRLQQQAANSMGGQTTAQTRRPYTQQDAAQAGYFNAQAAQAGPQFATSGAGYNQTAQANRGDAAQYAAQYDKARQQQMQAAAMGQNARNLAMRSRGDQMSNADLLRAQAQAPEGPSAAQVQLQQGRDASMAQALSMARLGGGAASQRQAMFQRAATGNQANAQAAQLRAQESQAFRQHQLSALGAEAQARQGIRSGDMSMRGQDLATMQAFQGMGAQDLAARGQSQGMEQFYAGMGNQREQFNAQLGTQAGQFNAGLRQQAALQNAQLGAQTGMFNAGQMNQNNQFYTGAALQNARQNDAYGLGLGQQALGYEGLGLGYQRAELGGAMGYEGLRAGSEMQARMANANFDYQRDNGILGLAATGLGIGAMAAMSGGAASDINAKKDVEDGGDAMDKYLKMASIASQTGQGQSPSQGFMNGMAIAGMMSDRETKKQLHAAQSELSRMYAAMGGFGGGMSGGDPQVADFRPAKPYSFQYKNPDMPGRGRGTFVGPMAQDLEKTPAGAQAVVNTPQGKMVDTGRLTMANTSGLGMQQRRLDELEQRQRLMAQAMGIG